MRSGRPEYRRMRTATRLAVVVLVVAGLALHAGWGTLSSLGLGAVASLCPLGALETLVASKLAVPRALVALAAMALVVVLLGRSFCSWICPVPPIQRFFRPGKKEEAEPAPPARGCDSCAGGCALPPVGGKRDGLRLDARHGVLAGALASSAVFGFPVFCLACPVGLTFATMVAVWRAFADHDPSWSLVVFPAILLVELVAFRKWCHVLCPLGAFMSLLGAKAPLAKPRVDEGACLRAQGVDCRACVAVCPESLDPHTRDLPECTRCGRCVERCPAGAIAMPLVSGPRPAPDADPAAQTESPLP